MRVLKHSFTGSFWGWRVQEEEKGKKKQENIKEFHAIYSMKGLHNDMNAKRNSWEKRIILSPSFKWKAWKKPVCSQRDQEREECTLRTEMWCADCITTFEASMNKGHLRRHTLLPSSFDSRMTYGEGEVHGNCTSSLQNKKQDINIDLTALLRLKNRKTVNSLRWWCLISYSLLSWLLLILGVRSRSSRGRKWQEKEGRILSWSLNITGMLMLFCVRISSKYLEKSNERSDLINFGKVNQGVGHCLEKLAICSKNKDVSWEDEQRHDKRTTKTSGIHFWVQGKNKKQGIKEAMNSHEVVSPFNSSVHFFVKVILLIKVKREHNIKGTKGTYIEEEQQRNRRKDSCLTDVMKRR